MTVKNERVILGEGIADEALALPIQFYKTCLHGVSVLILLGFVPAYWLQFTSLTISHHVHAAIAFSWLCVLNIQPVLASHGWRFYHRWLGWGAIIVAFMLVLSTLNLFMMTFHQRMHSSAIFTLVYTLDLYLLPAFTVCFLMAIRYRKQVVNHASYLLLATIMLLPPGVGRLIYGVFLLPFSASQRYFFEPMILSTLAVLILVGYREQWQRLQTLWITGGFIVATMLSYLVTYGVN